MVLEVLFLCINYIHLHNNLLIYSIVYYLLFNFNFFIKAGLSLFTIHTAEYLQEHNEVKQKDLFAHSKLETNHTILAGFLLKQAQASCTCYASTHPQF